MEEIEGVSVFVGCAPCVHLYTGERTVAITSVMAAPEHVRQLQHQWKGNGGEGTPAQPLATTLPFGTDDRGQLANEVNVRIPYQVDEMALLVMDLLSGKVGASAQEQRAAARKACNGCVLVVGKRGSGKTLLCKSLCKYLSLQLNARVRYYDFSGHLTQELLSSDPNEVVTHSLAFGSTFVTSFVYGEGPKGAAEHMVHTFRQSRAQVCVCDSVCTADEIHAVHTLCARGIPVIASIMCEDVPHLLSAQDFSPFFLTSPSPGPSTALSPGAGLCHTIVEVHTSKVCVCVCDVPTAHVQARAGGALPAMLRVHGAEANGKVSIHTHHMAYEDAQGFVDIDPSQLADKLDERRMERTHVHPRAPFGITV